MEGKMGIPKRLVVEFDDGSRNEIEFSRLNRQIQADLSELGLCSPPVREVSKSYILLRWQNGWQEIVGVEKAHLELLRYYTIERVEEIGRMSLEVGESYPVLLFVKRLPRQVESALLVDDTGTKVYIFAEKTTITEGDKTEHILYDKKNPKFTTEDSGKADSWVSELIDSVKAELEKRKLTAEQLLFMDSAQKAAVYGEISKAVGIRAMEKQEDVYGFIELMLRKVKT
jgi:hypothetical protein